MKQTEKLENNYAFTLIELLVSVSILATISIISYVSYAGHMKSVNNATRIETIDSLHLSLSDYYQQKKTLPEPNSNFISYDERGTYMHSSSGSYGVSGYVSNDFLPKGYVNFRATDPESNQFYGYGKLSDNTSFDIAATLYDEITGGYKTYLRGTYPKTRLSSLIRAYSSSNFVSQDSTENLPYNPYERKITAYLSSSSGTLAFRNSKGETLSLTGELNSGDIVTVATGSTALLHISDGSEISLGSTSSETVLTLNTLAYSDDNNLASRVVLFLTSGEVWTEAPHLRTEADSNSDFSIKTDSALAAVRGTVFGVTRDVSGTTLSLASGKLEVSKLDASGVNTSFTSPQGFSTTATGGFILNSTGSYMIVPDGGQPITLTVPPPSSPNTTSTGSTTPSAVKQKIQHPPFSLGYRPKADNISFSGTIGALTGVLSVTLQNPGADSYELSFGTGEVTDSTVFRGLNPNQILTGTLNTTQTLTTITGAFAYISAPHLTRTYTLRICSHGHCSSPDIKSLGGETFTFDNFRVWGEEKKTDTKILVGNWKDIDTNCSKSDITVGLQTWAGCNSTIGLTAIYYQQTYCYNYGGIAILCTAPPFGKSIPSMTESDYLAGQSNNIYGALYQWNTISGNTCLGTGIIEGAGNCPCKGGYHVPSDAEWTTLETVLGSSTGSNLGWASTNVKSLKNTLGLTLAGYCNSGGSCSERGSRGVYWSSTNAPDSTSFNRFLTYSNVSVLPGRAGQVFDYSVRCMKD